MTECKKLLKLYSLCKEQLHLLIENNKLNEEVLLKLINKISFEQTKPIIVYNKNYSTEIGKVFRFYENNMRNSFKENKQLFEIQFKLYLFLIELYTHLCKQFIKYKNKRIFVEPLLQTLKESKNLIKLFIPFEQKQLYIINNIIGEQLYTFTHTQYINPVDKTIDYVFQLYLLACEKIFDGFNLSISSEFGLKGDIIQEDEIVKIKNNISFLLLTMFHKIRYFFPDETIIDNDNFAKIYQLIKEQKVFEVDFSIENFEKQLFDEFKDSTETLKCYNNLCYYEEKLSLLYLDTDEYKELIDIIRKLK